ncbi:hypothetical protein NP233_g559 [Leucocoprinus birnbaumii]|uniref:Cytochrome P450 n=1 Tax=Leucocoprinus birnbaumii TaxID=56174 RepID=A0AAD5YYJ9_9AGAR|nr:hypothetical protein NP233_g559 [Leucocoprinus birnbaumii]
MDLVRIGEPAIVLSTPEAAIELLEKRGNIYSSRPRSVFAGEVAYRSAKGALLPMGTQLRRFRTLMTASLGTVPSKNFRPLEDPETRLMLRDLLQEPNPAKYRGHMQRSVHSVAFCTAYGQRIDRLGAEHLEFYNSVERFFVRFSSLPGVRLVDHLPILSKIPLVSRWFCGEAEEQGDKEERFFRSCMDQAKSAYVNGNAIRASSWFAMERQERFGYTELELALLSGAPYAAGVTTTLGSCETFLLAILLHPHVLERAQKEIDTVVGPERLPDFRDFDTLPYIRAMIKETLRWHPFTPLGIAHATTEDDVYEGMFIPAGSTVMANIYAITRNTEVKIFLAALSIPTNRSFSSFPTPKNTSPSVFLNTTDPLVKNYNMTFGFGRRICPGQHVATDQLFIMMSRILWAFDVKPMKGGPKLTEIHARHGFFGPPVPFPYELVPRSDRVRSLIMEQAALAEEDVRAWKTLDYDL